MPGGQHRPRTTSGQVASDIHMSRVWRTVCCRHAPNRGAAGRPRFRILAPRCLYKRFICPLSQGAPNPSGTPHLLGCRPGCIRYICHSVGGGHSVGLQLALYRLCVVKIYVDHREPMRGWRPDSKYSYSSISIDSTAVAPEFEHRPSRASMIRVRNRRPPQSLHNRILRCYVERSSGRANTICMSGPVGFSFYVRAKSRNSMQIDIDRARNPG